MKRLFYIVIVLLTLAAGCKNSAVDINRSSIPHLETRYSFMIRSSPGYTIGEDKYNDGCNKLKAFTLDYQGAIEDFSKAIQLNPKFVQAYENRGFARAHLQDYEGAISDYNQELEIINNDNIYPNHYKSSPFSDRGVAKYNLQDYRGAIEDFKKSIEFGGDATDRANISNAKYQLKDFKGVIEECDFIIEMSPINIYSKFDKNDAFYWRGLAKIQLGQKDSGCLDLSKAGELGYSDAYEDIKKYCK